MDRVNCTVFDEQLDAAERGELSTEGLALVHAHASECPSCRAILHFREQMPGPPLELLEARVPDAWVQEMEGRVRGALGAHPSRRGGLAPPAGGSRWTPLLAAAVMALLLATGLSLVALAGARDRAAALGAELVDQRRRIAALETATDLGDATPGNALRAGWVRSLRSRDHITVAELRALLEGLPDGASLVSATRIETLSRTRWVPPRWRRALEAVPSNGLGLTVAGARSALDHLDLPGDTRLPADRLVDLLS